MKILFLNCYDNKNPLSGGAEKVGFELLSRLAQKGHEVVWIAERFNKAPKSEVDRGIKVIRRGNRLTVLVYAFFHYWKHRREYDLVIDNFHGYPFLTTFYVGRDKRVAMIHEVAGKEVWLKVSKFPVNIVGIILESLFFKVLYKNEKFITVSKSTKNELVGYGILSKNISIIPEGIDQKVANKLPKKSIDPSLIYFGGLRKVKRVEDTIMMVDVLRKDFPKIKLYILGRQKGEYYKKIKKMIWDLKLERNVVFTGFLASYLRDELIRHCWINLGTSVKEGWGLVVTESNALGTPSVVYNVPGYKDSVRHYVSGLITIRNNPEYLAKAVSRLILDKELYYNLQSGGIVLAKKYTWNKSVKKMEKILYEKINGGKIVNLNKEPLVSIIIPTLNSAKFLKECLYSVVNQTYKNIEIILVDGGSIDKTVEIAKKFGAKVIKFNKGRSAQRNIGAVSSFGKYLYFIDSDVVLDANIVKSAVEQVREKEIDMIAVHYSSNPNFGFWSKIRKFEKDFFKYDTTNICPRFMKREAFISVRGFDEAMIAGEDYDLYNRLVKKKFKLGFIIFEENHLGEPRKVSEILKKNYFYGKTLAIENNGSSKLANLTFGQKFPIRPAYVKKLYRFILHPVLTSGFIVYNVVRFLAGGVGYMNGKVSGVKVMDKIFSVKVLPK